MTELHDIIYWWIGFLTILGIATCGVAVLWAFALNVLWVMLLRTKRFGEVLLLAVVAHKRSHSSEAILAKKDKPW